MFTVHSQRRLVFSCSNEWRTRLPYIMVSFNVYYFGSNIDFLIVKIDNIYLINY